MALQHKRILKISLLVALLATVGLACAQAGQIVSDAEATNIAQPTATPALDLSGEAEYQVGEQAQIVGGTFGALVPLYGEPNGRFFTSQVPVNALVTVLQLGQDVNGLIWYEVEGNAGQGWIRAANLRPPDIDLGVEEEAASSTAEATEEPAPTPTE